MNLEEMQQAWKELDERVARNEILHREEVKRILNTRRENSLERLTRLEKMGLAMVLIVCITFASAWIAQPGVHPLPGITGAVLNTVFLHKSSACTNWAKSDGKPIWKTRYATSCNTRAATTACC